VVAIPATGHGIGSPWRFLGSEHPDTDPDPDHDELGDDEHRDGVEPLVLWSL